jgi:uncharacterized UPF0160 family protein
MRTLFPANLNRFTVLFVILALLSPLLPASRTFAQERLSDQDVEQRMKNLYSDAKKFRSMFNSALSKSTIRKTGQEKDAKTYAEAFQNQTKNMADNFKQTKKADPYLQACLDAASKIDGVLKSTQLDQDTLATWSRIQGELNTLARTFHMPGY